MRPMPAIKKNIANARACKARRHYMFVGRERADLACKAGEPRTPLGPFRLNIDCVAHVRKKIRRLCRLGKVLLCSLLKHPVDPIGLIL